MKNAEALFLEHRLDGTLTVRNQAGNEVVTNSTKSVPLAGC
jgi:hypothetical protein